MLQEAQTHHNLSYIKECPILIKLTFLILAFPVVENRLPDLYLIQIEYVNCPVSKGIPSRGRLMFCRLNEQIARLPALSFNNK